MASVYAACGLPTYYTCVVYKCGDAAEVKSLTWRRNVHNWWPEGTKPGSVHIITLSHEESITGKKRGRQQGICEWHGVKSFMQDMTVRRHDVCSMQVNNWCLEYIRTKIELRRDFFVGIDFGFLPWDISLCILTTNAQLYVLYKFYQFMKMSKHLKHYSDCILNMLQKQIQKLLLVWCIPNYLHPFLSWIVITTSDVLLCIIETPMIYYAW